MWALIILLVSLVLLVVSLFFFWSDLGSQSLDPFECGIDPLSSVKTPFYMHFFFISILFLVFDVELALTLPLVVSYLFDGIWNIFWLSLLFILFFGLVLEVAMTTLSWKE